jgi:broad-specificity NMP kinase
MNERDIKLNTPLLHGLDMVRQPGFKAASSARVVLIAGISGSGKTSILRELKSRGHKTCELENVPGLVRVIDKNSGQIVSHYDEDVESLSRVSWLLLEDRLVELLDVSKGHFVFYSCFPATNLVSLVDHFDRRFLLRAEPAVLRQRMTARSGEFGKKSEVQDWVMSWKDSWEESIIRAGAKPIDSNRSVQEIAQELLDDVFKEGVST